MSFSVKEQNAACLVDIKNSEAERRTYCYQVDVEVRDMHCTVSHKPFSVVLSLITNARISPCPHEN